MCELFLKLPSVERFQRIKLWQVTAPSSRSTDNSWSKSAGRRHQLKRLL
jgi:hypothetical protein